MMIDHFSFNQVMKLSSIKRWVIIDMSREQSVAEHSYNVIAITSYIVDEMKRYIAGDTDFVTFKLAAIEWAMAHDLTELVTGDLPTPMKQYIGKVMGAMEKEQFPIYHEHKKYIDGTLMGSIVKIADYIDAIQFAKRYCIDDSRNEIILEMSGKLKYFMSLIPKYSIELDNIVENIWQS